MMRIEFSGQWQNIPTMTCSWFYFFEVTFMSEILTTLDGRINLSLFFLLWCQTEGMSVYCLKASIIKRLVKYTLYTDQQVGHAADLLERISPPFVGGFVSALGGRISLHPEWREVDLQLRRVLKRSLSTATGQPVGGRAPIMRENKRQQTAPQSPIKERTGKAHHHHRHRGSDDLSISTTRK